MRVLLFLSLILMLLSPVAWTSEVVTLRVGATAENDAQPLSYTWSLDSAPAEAGSVEFSAPQELDPADVAAGMSNRVEATLQQPRPGIYTFLVTITDSQGLSATSRVSLTVLAARRIRMQVLPAGMWSCEPSGDEAITDTTHTFSGLQPQQAHTLHIQPESLQ